MPLGADRADVQQLYCSLPIHHRRYRSPPRLGSRCRPKSAAPGIRSKHDLLTLVRRLYLEYCDKGPPTYSSLMFGGPSYFHLLGSVGRQGLREFCKAEAEWIGEGAKRLAGRPKDLISIALGALLPAQAEIWGTLDDELDQYRDIQKHIIGTTMAVTRLITTCGLTQHAIFCHRTEYGPLTFHPGLYNGEEDGVTVSTVGIARRYEHRKHIQGEIRPDQLPLNTGGQSRWYCTSEEYEHELAASNIVEDISSAVEKQVYHRAGSRDDLLAIDGGVHAVAADQPFSVNICVPRHLMSAQAMETLQRQFDKMDEKEWTGPGSRLGAGLSKREKDEFRLSYIEDSPACEACSWNYEDDMVSLS